MGKIKRTEHKKKREYTRENMPKGLVFLILANIFFCIIFFSVVSIIVWAEEKIDWNKEMDDGEFASHLEEDPASAFKMNSNRAFQAIGRDTGLLLQQEIAHAAFNQNSQKTADIINQNPNLLGNDIIMVRFGAALAADIQIANNNLRAKAAWLLKKYSLMMVDNTVPLADYDGERITTGGIRGTTFTAVDFPQAKILEDGCLEQNLIKFCASKVSIKRGPHGGKVYTGGIPNYEVSSGVIEILARDLPPDKNVYLFVDGAEVQLPGSVPNSYTLYTGSFRFVQDTEGMLIKSACQQACTAEQWVTRYSQKFVSSNREDNREKNLRESALEFVGVIEDPHTDEHHEFAVYGDSQLKFADGAALTTKTSERVYYTERNNHQADQFCNPSFSCIVNTAGENNDPDYQDTLGFRHIQNGDEITFSSPAYHSSISTDVADGRIRFISREKRDDGLYYDIAQITAGRGDDIAVRGNLEAMKAGRFDARHTAPGGTELLTHWSSNGFQKEDTAAYFSQPHTGLATCAVDDCEQVFARSFGKILGPPGKDPEVTILVAGDNAFTAQTMEAECRRMGCYILNSRDAPPRTKSGELIITGHHWGTLGGGGGSYVWRDPPDQITEHHNPIDRFYFEDLPKGPVKTVRFSACNTVVVTSTGRTYPGFEKLRDRYPQLRFVQGWNMIGLRQEFIPRPSPEAIQSHILERLPDPKTGISRGQRAWYVFKEPPGEWIWTNGKKEQAVVG